VGPRVRELRHRPGREMTQEELAARLQALGVDLGRSAVAKIETGRRPVTDVEIVALCKVLGVKVGALFGEDEKAAT